MRMAHTFRVAIVACVLLALPRSGASQSDKDFGDFVVYYSTISTNQLLAEVAKQYGIERSSHRGLLNVAVEEKRDVPHTVSANVVAEVSDLSGHSRPVVVHETSENGGIDYVGEFNVEDSGTYLFTVKITPVGHEQPYVLKFSQDYIVD
jgi:hypothetical protein